MPAERSAPDLAEQLIQARHRISELEAANAELQRERAQRELIEEIRDQKSTIEALRVREEELRKTAAAFARTNEDLLHFAYTVSHDLQAPLRNITILSQLLELQFKHSLDVEGGKIISGIVSGSARMFTMLRDLLAFAKVAGSENAPHAEAELEQALASALESLRSAMSETEAVITQDRLPTVPGDAGQFAQLFQNLIGNSLKYRKPGTLPRIHVSSQRVDDEWVITVRDNGIGFDPKYAQRIFGVFQRLHGSDYAGTGIGLTICKRIVERAGGRIWAEASPGEGAVFSFSMPARKGTSAIPAPRAAVPNSAAPSPIEDTIFDELFHALDLAQAVVRELDGTILIWTKGAEQLFGYSRSEAVGQKIQALLDEEFASPRLDREAELWRTGEWSGQMRARKKDGTAIWLASHWSLHRDGSGRPKSVVEVHNGITALKDAEAALLVSSEQRRLALKAGQMGIWQWDSRTGHVEREQMIERILGLAPGSLKPTLEDFFHRVHPEDLGRLQALMTAAFEKRRDYTAEFRIRHADGRYLWVQVVGQLTVDDQDQPTGLIGVLWDITPRKEAELALQESEARFRALFHNAATPMLTTLENGSFEQVNRAFLDLLGYSEEELQRINFLEVTHPEDRSASAEGRRRLLAREIQEFRIEKRYLHKDGRAIWCDTSVAVVLNPAGAVAGFVAQTRDITERKQAGRDQQFLLHLSASWTKTRASAEVIEMAVTELGRYLGACRCAYSEVDHATNLIHTFPDYHEGSPSGAGSYPVDTYGDFAADFQADRLITVDDAETDPRTAARFQSAYIPMVTRSFVALPLHREAVWSALIAVVRPDAHVWERREIALLRRVAERLWPVLENARLLEDVRERQELFENTFNQTAAGISHLNLDGGWLRVNDRVCEITGYSREELLKLRFRDITHPDDLPGDQAQFDAIKRGEGKAFFYEKRYLHKSGSHVWVRRTLSLGRDSAGTPSYMIAVIEDISDRKRAEAELEKSSAVAAARLREIEAIYAEAPVALGILDRDLRYVRINERLAQINGRPVADHLGRTLCEVLPELGPRMEPVFRGVLDTGVPALDIEIRGVTPGTDGAEHTWLASHFPVFGEAGEVVGVNAVVQDITERKAAETGWLETAERLNIAASAANLGVLSWEISADRMHWENDRMYEIFGRSREQGALSRAEFFADVIHPEDGGIITRFNEEVLTGRRAESQAYRIRRGDGAIRWIQFHAQAQRGPDGSVVRVAGVTADVTDRVEAERALRDSQTRLRQALDAAELGTWNIEPATGVFTFDERFGAICGISAQAWDNVHPEDAERVRAAIEAATRPTDPAGLEIEYRAVHADGSVHWVLAKGRAEFSGDGALLRFAGTVADISERKRVELLLATQKEVLEMSAGGRPLGDILHVVAGAARQHSGERSRSGVLLMEADGRHLRYAASAGVGEDLIRAIGRVEAGAEWPWIRDAVNFPAHGKEQEIAATWAQPLSGSDGKVLGMLVIFQRTRRDPGQNEIEAMRLLARTAALVIERNQELEQRGRAEAALRESEERSRLMLDSIDQLAWMAQADGYIYWYNRRWYEYTGAIPEQMEGWGWQSIHDAAKLPAVMERWTASIQTGQPFDMEFPLRGADGVYRPFLTRVVPLLDSEGRALRWFGTNTNIETLRKEQDILRESERKFRELAEALPDLIGLSDPHHNITYLNREFHAYTGVDVEKGGTFQWQSILHPDDAGPPEGTDQPYEREVRLRRHDGVYRWFLVRSTPLKDEQGAIAKWLGSATDIHEQKLTEEALRYSNEDLEQFAYAASHELSEPLRTVSLQAQLLARAYSDQGTRSTQLVESIVKETRRMDSLLKGLLAYSSAGETVEASPHLDSGTVLAEALRGLAPAIAESGSSVTHDALPLVVCARTHLVELFTNLIGNAIRYRGDRAPRIHVSASRQGNWQEFSITDNGIGIEPEYLDRIFGVFKRLHRDEYPGVGVGLAICKRIVERAGGRIRAESEPGRGTTFHFTLPAAEQTL